MYYEIKFISEREAEDFKEITFAYLKSLELNGQIVYGSFKLIFESKYKLIYLIKLPALGSLRIENNNVYVNQRLSSLKQSGIGISTKKLTPKTSLRAQPSKRKRLLVLSPLSLEESSPIKYYDGLSFGYLPLYSIPKTFDNSYWDILSWCKDYMAFYNLYHSGYDDVYSYTMLTNVKKELLINGLEICKLIEKITKIPTVIEVFYSEGEKSLNRKNFENILNSFKPLVDGFRINYDLKLII